MKPTDSKDKLEKPISMTVKATTGYVEDQSDPGQKKFVWAYEISITNHSDEFVQLLNRTWHITDMSGKVDEVHGTGVVGLQPLIKPGKEFVYTSYCQLSTPQGTMEGFYEMQNLEETRFKVTVPKFALSAPNLITDAYRSKLH